MAKLLIVGKLILVGSLLFVFLRYFGVVSWQKYQSKNVYVTKSWDRPDFLPLPAITICPQSEDSGSSFKNLSKEGMNQARKEGKTLMEYVCEDLEGKDLVECVEREVISLADFVTFEETHGESLRNKHDIVAMNPPVQSHWSMSLTKDKGPCFTYQNTQHMETKTMLKIGLNASFKHTTFIHDPRFFINSQNPAIPVNKKNLRSGDWHLIKLTVVEHRNLDVPDKRCDAGQNYSLNGCVREVFSKEVGCSLHWDHTEGGDLPICSTADQHE